MENTAIESEDLHLLRQEVDALQVAIREQKTPWYSSPSNLISAMALLFSFGTTFVSYHKASLQDIQNERIELRGLLLKLASLPRDNFELARKYAHDPTAIATLSGINNQQNALLARQAAEIARNIPQELVSATESLAVAMALQNAYNNAGAEEFMKRAIDTSKDFNDKVAALRAYANLLFMTGRADAGRAEYRKALDIFSEYPGYNAFTQKFTHFWTELNWIYSEANIGSMDMAMQHIESAEQLLAGLPATPFVAQLRAQIQQARAILASGKSAPGMGQTETAP